MTSLRPLSSELHQEDGNRSREKSISSPPRVHRYYNGLGSTSHQTLVRQSRSSFPYSPDVSDVNKVSNSPAVLAAQSNKFCDSAIDEARDIAPEEQAVVGPVGELECIASGFVSIDDYIFIAESLKTLSVRLLGAGTKGMAVTSHDDEARRRCLVGDHSPHSASAWGASWAVMRDALVNKQHGSAHGNTGVVKSAADDVVENLKRSATTAATEGEGRDDTLRVPGCLKSADSHGVETTAVLSSTKPHLVSVDEVYSKGEGSDQKSVGIQKAVKSLPEASLATTGLPRPGKTPCSTTDATTEMDTEADRRHPTRSGGDFEDGNRGVSDMTAATPLPPSPRPLSMSDLTAISEHDEVLDFYLQSLAKRVQGISSKLRAMKPCSVLHLFLAAALYKTDWSSMAALLPTTASAPVRSFRVADDSVAKALPLSNAWISNKEVVLSSKSKDETLASKVREDALTAMGEDLVQLLTDTKDITLYYMSIFADSMPLNIFSRLKHKYLSPSSAIVENYVGCGLYTRRAKEFFVSLTERVALLREHKSFTTPQELLLAICQLSTLASQIMSSFAIGAVLGCVSRWRELLESGHTKSDEATVMMEQFVTSYCTGYDILMNEAFPAVRRQYPNVFLACLFTTEDGGMPPMLTVEVSMLMKLIFLLAGGLGSIRADDRRMIADALREEQQRETERHSPKTALYSWSGASDIHSPMPPTATAALTRGTASLPVSTSSPLALHRRTGSPSRKTVSLPLPIPVTVTGSSSPRTPSLSRVNGRTRAPERASTSTASASSRSEGSTTYSSGTRYPDFSLACGEGLSGNSSRVSDDVALSVALQVPSATLIVGMGALLMSGPLVAHTPIEDSVRTARAVSRIWRILFQTAGFLPLGPACPVDMAEWLPLFPLYTLSTYAKHAMLSVFARTVGQTPLTFGPVLRGDVLRSAADAINVVAPLRSEQTAVSTPSAAVMGQRSAPNLGSFDSSAEAVVAGGRTPREKPTAPALQQRSYILCPYFAPAPSHIRHDTSDVDPYHVVPPEQCTPSMATERRQDLYELCARQSAAVFLPGVVMTEHVDATPLPGGVAMLRVDALADHSPAALQRLKMFHGQLALIMSWRSPPHGCLQNPTPTRQTADACDIPTLGSAPVREGDEVTIHWGGTPVGKAAATASHLLAHLYNPTSLMSQQSPVTARNTKRSEAPETASGAGKTRAQACMHSNAFHSHLHGSHHSKPTAVNQTKETGTAILSPTNESSHTNTAVGEPTSKDLPDVRVPETQRCRISIIVKTTNPNLFVVVLDAPNCIAPRVDVVSRTALAAADTTTTIPIHLRTAKQPDLLAAPSPPVCCQNGASTGQNASTVMNTVLSLTRSVKCLFHHRRHCAPLAREGNSGCAWANPEFLRGVGAHHPADLSFSSAPAEPAAATLDKALRVPTLLGWLLGQSPGNDLVFTVPLPPLAFRVLSLAVQLDLPIEAIHLSAADVSLLYPDLTNAKPREQLLQDLQSLFPCQETRSGGDEIPASSSGCDPKRTDGRPALDGKSISPNPAVARRQHQLLKKLLVDISSSILSKVGDNAMAGHEFWTAVLHGMRQTPLMNTPLFAQCSSRIVRDVLCGPCDHLQEEFTFRRSFVLLVEDDVKGGGSSVAPPEGNQGIRHDRDFVRKAVMRVLDELPLKQRRLLLRFMTGNSLRTRRSQMNTLRLVVQSGFPMEQPQHGASMAIGGVANTEMAPRTGGHGDHAHTSTAPYPITPAESIARSRIDATLQLLPVAHPSENMLVIPNYFETLLMGSYRKRVLGADLPVLSPAFSMAATSPEATFEGLAVSSVTAFATECPGVPRVTKENPTAPLFDDADVQLAWTQLTETQQTTLCRRYRELLRHRVRSALYVYLASNADTMEDAWELGLQTGFISAAEHRGKATTTAGESDLMVSGKCSDHNGNNGVARSAHTFVRCADGTVLYNEHEMGKSDAACVGDVGDFSGEDNFDESELDEYLLLANLGKDMAVRSAKPILCESGGLDDSTASSGCEGRARQHRRTSRRTAQPLDSPSASCSDVLSDSKLDSLHGYCTAATFQFPEDTQKDTRPTEPDMADAENIASRRRCDTDLGAAAPAGGGDHRDSGSVGQVASAGPHALCRHAPPRLLDAPASTTKRPMSNSQCLLPMPVAPPRDPSTKAVGMTTFLQRSRIAAAAKASQNSATALPDIVTQNCARKPALPLALVGRKSPLKGVTRTASPNPAIKAATATPAPAADTVAVGCTPLQIGSKDAQLRAEVDSRIRELFSEGVSPL
ncbi:hypothetical protein JKF63_06295 [Porcisia hertigi]|uniref:Uncharacterized protein n=1 Tax=Porcisia hertigi TaxID=2761500 RepID=A0A836IYU8_9TRYP|nr:hypothetical protein JKF63_06295 [Porcisia hertigi]